MAMIDVHIANDIRMFALKNITFVWTGANNTLSHWCFVFCVDSINFYVYLDVSISWIDVHFVDSFQLNSKTKKSIRNGWVCLFLSAFFYILFIYFILFFLWNVSYFGATFCVAMLMYLIRKEWTSETEREREPDASDENFMLEFYWYLYNDFVLCFEISRYIKNHCKSWEFWFFVGFAKGM